MPTFLSVAGADYPDVYNGESIVPLQGKSIMPLLNGESPIEADSRELGWSAYGMDAYRKGQWKVLRLPAPYGNGDWQLYDLVADPGELHDLSSEFQGSGRSVGQRMGGLRRIEWRNSAERCHCICETNSRSKILNLRNDCFNPERAFRLGLR